MHSDLFMMKFVKYFPGLVVDGSLTLIALLFWAILMDKY